MHLSAMYLAADRVSSLGQRSTKNLVTMELVSLIVASLAGIGTYRAGAGQYDVLAVVSAAAFLVALGATIRRAASKPEEDWYNGRAAAESARTLAWKYAMNSAPFPRSLGEAEAAEKYLRRLRQVLEQLNGAKLPPPAASDAELTVAMRQMRAAGIDVQRQAYKRDRIEDQIAWYGRRSGDHQKSANWWLGVAISSSTAGLVAAGVKFYAIDADLLGVFAAIASSAIAWNQLNQHRNQSTAYAIAARELNIIRAGIDTVQDAEWPEFVADSEEAISREHTMWLARHGTSAIQ